LISNIAQRSARHRAKGAIELAKKLLLHHHPRLGAIVWSKKLLMHHHPRLGDIVWSKKLLMHHHLAPARPPANSIDIVLMQKTVSIMETIIGPRPLRHLGGRLHRRLVARAIPYAVASGGQSVMMGRVAVQSYPCPR
jgi:hypothetical protein